MSNEARAPQLTMRMRVALFALLACALLAVGNVAGAHRFWFAAYRLVAAVLAFLLARRGLGFRDELLGLRRWLCAGLGLYLAGEAVGLALLLAGGDGPARFSEVLGLIGGVIVGVGLLVHVGRGMLGVRASRVELWTDAAACLVAILAGTVLRIGPVAAERSLGEAVQLLLHPVAFLVPGAIALLAALLARQAPRPRGAYAFGLGWLLMGSAHGLWSMAASHASSHGGEPLDLLAGVGLLVAGHGVGTWDARPARAHAPRWPAVSRGLAELLPTALLAAVLLDGVIAPSTVGRSLGSVALGSVVVALVARQGVLLGLALAGRTREEEARRDAAAAIDRERSAIRRLRDIAQHSRDAFWLIGADGRSVLYASPGVRETFGLDAADLEGGGRELLGLAVLPEDREAVATWLPRHRSGEVAPCDYRIALPTGEIRDISDRATAVVGDDGSVERFVVVSRDVTEERQREARLLRLEIAVEAMGESVMITDRDGMIRFVNPAFERITGHQARRVLGKTPRILKSGEHGDETYLELWSTILAGDTWHGTLRNRRADGELYDAQVTISPILDANGEAIQFVSIMRDISRERELEEEVRQAQRMESIGRLSAGVAHDFNNLLTVINGYAGILLGEAEAGSDDHDALSEIARAGESAASLTRQLLAFSRKQVFRMQQVDLGVLLLGLEDMLSRALGEGVRLELRVEDDVPTVRIDPAQLEQVVVNLLVNARDAMPQGGRVEVSCEREPSDEGTSASALIHVRDEGCGIPAEVRSRIFDPFFTTQPVGAGSGLGLSTAYGIITQAGGEIWVESEVDVGSTFTIRLPASAGFAAEAGAGPDPDVASDPPPAHRVLLIEDDDAVRATVSVMLRRAGYLVNVAASREEAIRAAASGPIDVIVSDVILPGASGRGIVEELLGGLGEVPVLYISGYPAEDLSQHGVLEDEVELLHKPFRPEELVRRIEALRAHRPTLRDRSR